MLLHCLLLLLLLLTYSLTQSLTRSLARSLTHALTHSLTHSLTANEFSLGGSSPYTSTDKTNNIHKLNNTKTQYKQYKTQ